MQRGGLGQFTSCLWRAIPMSFISRPIDDVGSGVVDQQKLNLPLGTAWGTKTSDHSRGRSADFEGFNDKLEVDYRLEFFSATEAIGCRQVARSVGEILLQLAQVGTTNDIPGGAWVELLADYTASRDLARSLLTVGAEIGQGTLGDK